MSMTSSKCTTGSSFGRKHDRASLFYKKLRPFSQCMFRVSCVLRGVYKFDVFEQSKGSEMRVIKGF